MKQPEQEFTLLNNLKDEQLEEISLLAGDLQTDLSHIYKAIDELQKMCWREPDAETSQYINGEVLADIKDILKKI